MTQLIEHGFTYDPPVISLQLVNRTTTDFIIDHDDNMKLRQLILIISNSNIIELVI